jgi:murein L,D-transpeptidase YcbB/YkuD
MAIACFGNKIFNVSLNRIYTIDEFGLTSGLDIEEQEVEGKKPSTYIKGSQLNEVSFTVPLIAQKSINIKSEIDSWIKIKDKGTPYMLLLANKPISSTKYLLININIQNTVFDIKGNYIRANIQLQFKEFVRYGKKEEEDSSDKKRENTNASAAKASGTKSKSSYPGYLIRYNPNKKDNNVIKVQQKLGISADGYFGNNTLDAVKKFQGNNGLKQDGIVGPATWAKLFG